MNPNELLPELSARWDVLRQGLNREEGDALLVTSNVNLYYISGRIFSGMAYLPAEGDPLFFVRRPVGLEGDRIVYIRKPEEAADYLKAHGYALPRTLLVESDSITLSEYLRYEKVFTPAAVKNGTPLLRRARSIKSAYEIGLICRSALKHAEVYKTIPSLYREGMTEIELSTEIERESRRRGSLGLFRICGQSMEIFAGTVLAGDNADTPSPYDFALGGAGLDPSIPIGGNGTVLRPGMSIMVDLGGNFTGYITDMSRVFSVGTLPDVAYRAHEVSLDIQQRVMQTARPGTPAADLYNLAVETAREAGLEQYFMGYTQKAGFVGHGIGIEINEAPVLAPRSKERLEAGMVFALEPKFVIPGTGAVGIENSFVVTDNGLEKLTLLEEGILALDGSDGR